MKVTIEGTTEEVFALSDLFGFGKISFYSVRDLGRDGRKIQTGDDVPNRDREEGVQ